MNDDSLYICQFEKVTHNADAGEDVDIKALMDAIEKEWDLKRPNLVISVTGGAWDFPMNSHVREVFRKGIVEAAVSTGKLRLFGSLQVLVHMGGGGAV